MPQIYLKNFQTHFIAAVKARPESINPSMELDYGILRISDSAANVLLNPAAGDWYVLKALKNAETAESDYEILHVTEVDNSIIGECRIKVIRGQEETKPKSYVAGDLVMEGNTGQNAQMGDSNVADTRVSQATASGMSSGDYLNSGFIQSMTITEDLLIDNSIDIRDFGALPTATPAVNRAAIQAALNAASGISSVYVPYGTYLVDGTIRIPSNTRFFGDGAASIIKMASNISRIYPLIQTGTRNNKVVNVILENMTFDFNSSRWTVTGGSYEYDTDGITRLNMYSSTLAICYTEYSIFRNLRCLDGYKHSLDILAPKYKTSSDASVYDTQPSRFIWIEDCYIRGGGDDNVTTHHSSDIWITRVVSEKPSGVRTPGNSNCFEIDDGSRNIFITDCIGIGGVYGLQIKGHNNAPAPHNVIVSGFKAINCAYGVELRHTGYYGSEIDEDTGSDDSSEDSDPEEGGSSVSGSGNSATARNVTLNNIEIIAPRNVVNNKGTNTQKAKYGLRVRSYANVLMSNIRINDGSSDNSGDYQPKSTLTGYNGAVVRIYGGAKKINISNISIYGFNDSENGICVTGSMGDGLYINGITSIDGPQRVVRISGSNPLIHGVIENYFLSGNWPNNSPIYVTSPNIRIGQGSISGYANFISADGNLVREVRRRALSGSNVPTKMATVDSFIWNEGSQDLGAGEGLKLSWGVNLLGDTQDYEIGYVGFRKTNSSDSSRMSDFAVAVSSNGIAEPADALIIEAAGPVRPGTDAIQSLGKASHRFSQVFASTGSINTSDMREKTPPQPINDAVLDAWGDVQIATYQWLSAIQTKGDNLARWHIGVIAQNVRDAFAARGIDGVRYGLLCYDECEAGGRWGIRADQCLFLEAAWQRRERAKDRAEFLAFKQEVFSILTKARSAEN